MKDYEKIFTDKIEKGLLAHGFEQVRQLRIAFRRKKTKVTETVRAYIRIEQPRLLPDLTCVQTIVVEFSTDFGIPGITRTDGYIIIHHTTKGDEFVSARAICSPSDISVVNTTIKDIRKRLISTGYFGRYDI